MSKYDIVVDDDETKFEKGLSQYDPMEDARQKLIGWVNDKVEDWIDYRKVNFDQRWDEYYRLWRGVWNASDKTRQSERSKLISPALQQAIESSVAELEEATFGRGQWFDVDDDYVDQDRADADLAQALLDEDFDNENVPSTISEIYLNGALYGTGIGKIITQRKVKTVPKMDSTAYGAPTFLAEDSEYVCVGLEAIPPQNFCIDPTARNIDEAMGCAIEYIKPKHEVFQKMEQGIYTKQDIGSFTGEENTEGKGEFKTKTDDNKVRIVEYYGLIPRNLFELIEGKDTEAENVVDLYPREEENDDTLYVECIVTIANDSALLKCVENPYTMKDRPIIAYQHDTVPNRFWGRGIAEKGYNPQKALDAELRARIDGLALTIHPMMAADSTRLPRGADLSVAPGKTILTTGDPSSALLPFKFGEMSPNTFHQSGELERMIQMGTGAMDSATPIGVSPRNQTASGMSMIAGGAIKRSKRTLQNIERNFLKPLVKKTLYRQMQFNPERYPITDVEFKITSTLGIMAREYEQAQLTQLLQSVPPDSPTHFMILRGIFANSNVDDKEAMLKTIDMMMQQAMNPQPPPPDPMVMIKQAELQLRAKDLEYRAATDVDRLMLEKERVRMDAQDRLIEFRRLELEEEKIEADAVKKYADGMLAMAKAEAEEVGQQLQSYNEQLTKLQLAHDKALEVAEKMGSDSGMRSEILEKKISSVLDASIGLQERMLNLENKPTPAPMVVNNSTEAAQGGMMAPQQGEGMAVDLSGVEEKLSALTNMMSDLKAQTNQPKKIVRDASGRVVSVNGRTPKRNPKTGLIEEI